MIRRLHGWLVTHFLPVWAKETILEENKRLRAELEQQRAENRELRAYARGLEEGLSALHGMRLNITLEGGGPDEHSESAV